MDTLQESNLFRGRDVPLQRQDHGLVEIVVAIPMMANLSRRKGTTRTAVVLPPEAEDDDVVQARESLATVRGRFNLAHGGRQNMSRPIGSPYC